MRKDEERQGQEQLPELMRVKDVCEALGISGPSVYRIMESGEIPYVKMGRSRRVKKEDVLAYIDRNTVRRV